MLSWGTQVLAGGSFARYDAQALLFLPSVVSEVERELLHSMSYV